MNYKNNKCIISVIFSFILLFAAAGARGSENVYCSVIVEINDNNAKLISLDIADKTASFAVLEADGKYFFSVIGDNNEIIKNEPLLPLGKSPISTGEDDLYLISFAYGKEAEKIAVNGENGNENLVIDLVPYKTCGNNVCEEDENYKICRLDCPAGSADGYCDQIRDGICDPDCFGQGEFRDSDCIALQKKANQDVIKEDSALEKQDIARPYKNTDNSVKIIILALSVLLGLCLIAFGFIKLRKIDS